MEDGATTTNRTAKPYPAELRGRAVRPVREQEAEHLLLAAAIRSEAAEIGCSAETLRLRVRQAGRDAGRRGGAHADEGERIEALEREVRELRQANEILRKAGACFAPAELDRRSKP